MKKKKLSIVRKELSKPSKLALENFDNSAQGYGIQLEHGCGISVDIAGIEYDESKAELVKRLLYLENSNRHLRNQVKKLKESINSPDVGKTDTDCGTV